MALFLDSAVIREVERASSLGFVSGATTNPTLLVKAGHTDFHRALEGICSQFNRSTRFTGDGIALIGNLRIILSGTQCEILAASIKSSAEAAEVLLAGSHHISVPFVVIADMAENSLSQMAIGEFDQKLSQMEALSDNRK